MLKRFAVVFALAYSLILTGYAPAGMAASIDGAHADESAASAWSTWTDYGNAEFLEYIQDAVYASVVDKLGSEDYLVEDVRTVYLSQEYLDEVAYNSQSNVFFGYTIEELAQQFGDVPYVLTLGDDGTTVAVPLEDYDDAYRQVIQNVAIGTGVILVCVTVSVATGGLGMTAVSTIFAVSAKAGAIGALSAGGISGAIAGVTTGVATGDMDQALRAAALSASEEYKFGAVAGIATGAAVGVANAAKAAKAVDNAVDVADAAGDTARVADNAADAAKLADDGVEAVPGRPTWHQKDAPSTATPADDAVGVVEAKPKWAQAEDRAVLDYQGTPQKTYLGGKEVEYGTPGATRPDVIRTLSDGTLEAIEVKHYDLSNPDNVSSLCSTLKRQVAARVVELPEGSVQRVVLDVVGKDYPDELIESVKQRIWKSLAETYPNIPIDVRR